MSFDIITGTLASAVADSGTVTIAYPDKRSQGDYDWGSKKHVLVLGQSVLNAPADFTLTFNVNASDITLTNASGGVWAAGTAFTLQAERLGANDGDPSAGTSADRARQIAGEVALINLGSPDLADANGYVESQDLTALGVFSVGATAAAAIAAAALDGTADVPRNVVASWTGTAVLTVTGTDEYGNVIVASSTSGTSLTGKKAFKTVTGISTSANITSLTVGTGDVLGLPVRVGKLGNVLGEFKDGVLLARTGGQSVYLQDHMLEAAIDAGTPLELVAPVAGRIAKFTTMTRGAITTGGAITVEVNAVAVSGVSVVVADGAAAGDVDSDVPTAGHATAIVAEGDRIEIIPAAAFNASADIFVVVEIEATYATQGTFVAAVDTEPSATTGDVRGTYAPYDACDGDGGYMLLAFLPDPADKGLAQYAG